MKKNLMIAMILVSAVLVASLFFIPKLNAGESNCGGYDVTCPGAGGCDCDYGTEGDVYVGEVAPGVYVCKPACGLGASCVQGNCVTQNILSIRQGAGFIPVAGTDTKLAVKSVDTVLGTTDVVVQDSTGRMQTVTVAANGHARLSDGTTLSVGAIESGRLFSRGSKVGIIVTPAGEAAGVGAGAVTGSALCPNNQLLELGVLKVDSITNNCASKLSIGAPEIGIGSGTGGVTIDSQGIVTILGYPIRLNSKLVEIGTAKESVIIKGYAYFNTLSGSGNAYACLDTNGMLFRSLTPCV